MTNGSTQVDLLMHMMMWHGVIFAPSTHAAFRVYTTRDEQKQTGDGGNVLLLPWFHEVSCSVSDMFCIQGVEAQRNALQTLYCLLRSHMPMTIPVKWRAAMMCMHVLRCCLVRVDVRVRGRSLNMEAKDLTGQLLVTARLAIRICTEK
jgi:hypothetical protein